jgi:DNA-binding response OmpR family regulator
MINLYNGGMRILLIEDDKKISAFIKKGLKEDLMNVDQAYDGEEGLYLAETNRYDVMIVDWMLPGLSGPEIIEKIRKHGDTTPVLMLTARGDIEDRVAGLEAGADDYLAKPFAFSELVARIRALHRRSGYDERTVLEAGDLTLDPLRREVKRGGSVIDLSAKEFELLEYLLRNKGKVVTHTMIGENIWDMQTTTLSNVINVTIYHLRNKIDKNFSKKLIQTVRGSGYRIVDA